MADINPWLPLRKPVPGEWEPNDIHIGYAANPDASRVIMEDEEGNEEQLDPRQMIDLKPENGTLVQRPEDRNFKNPELPVERPGFPLQDAISRLLGGSIRDPLITPGGTTTTLPMPKPDDGIVRDPVSLPEGNGFNKFRDLGSDDDPLLEESPDVVETGSLLPQFDRSRSQGRPDIHDAIARKLGLRR